MAARRLSGGNHHHHQQQQLAPHHHQWLAPLCGDAGRLGALVEELGGMVMQQAAGAGRDGRVVTHVVGVGMEGEGDGAGQGASHTGAFARALAGRLGAAYLPAAPEEEEGQGGEGRVALLCCAWVHSGARLEAAAQGLVRQGYRVAGIAALRFEANEHTGALAAAHRIYARSWAHGACPLPLPPPSTTDPSPQPSATHRPGGGGGGRRRSSSSSSSASSDQRTQTSSEPLPPISATAAAGKEAGAGMLSPPSQVLMLVPSEEDDEGDEGLAPMGLTQEEECEEEEASHGTASTTVDDEEQQGAQAAAVVPPLPSPVPSPSPPHEQQPQPHAQPSNKRKTAASPAPSVGEGPSLKLTHSSAFVEANDPGEDRFANRGPRPDHDGRVRADGLYAVMDGHGGPRAAEFASQVLIPLIIRRLEALDAANKNKDEDEDEDEDEESDEEARRAQVVAALKAAFVQADEDFLGQLDPNVTVEEARGYWNAGTCVVLALVRKGVLYVAHVGDCRAVLVRSAQPIPAPSPSSSNPAAFHKKGRRSHSSSSSTPSPTPTDSNTVVRASPRRACAVPRLGPPPLRVVGVALTRDHGCGNAKEVRLVKERCRDPNPIRLSFKDSGGNNGSRGNGGRAAAAAGGGAGTGGVNRVAGSLMVTRALGDAYLKRPSLSFPPYKQYVPYIIPEPEVAVHELDPRRDRFLVLATDGLWERVSNEEAAAAVEKFTHYHGSAASAPQQSPQTASEALVEEALNRVAALHGMAPRTLKRLPRGGQRRGMHDDVCVTVVRFGWGEGGEGEG